MALLDEIRQKIDKLNIATDAEWDYKLAAVKKDVEDRIGNLLAQNVALATALRANENADNVLLERTKVLETALVEMLDKLSSGDIDGAVETGQAAASHNGDAVVDDGSNGTNPTEPATGETTDEDAPTDPTGTEGGPLTPENDGAPMVENPERTEEQDEEEADATLEVKST